MGGYEYTPLEINKRDSEKLVDKHNESLKVMPKLFADNGYDVVVCDPPYAGYEWIPDITIYEDINENIKPYITKGAYINTVDSEILKNFNDIYEHNFGAYSIMKSLPLIWQNCVYDDAGYLYYDREPSIGIDFLNSFSVLTNLEKLTEISNDSNNNLLMMDNETTHSTCCLDMPDYLPKSDIEYTAYENLERFEGFRVNIEGDDNINQYCTNIAAIDQLSKWLMFLKENDVYDNTRLIVVADHGVDDGNAPELILDDGTDCEAYNPLLLVKDFNAEGEISTSQQFMTNADVPTLMTEDIIVEPINPYTGKNIVTDKDEGVYITTSHNLNITINNGNVFDVSDGKWLMVHGDIFNRNN